MGLFNFIKTAGQKIFKNKKAEEQTTEEDKHVAAQELLDYIKTLGFDVAKLRVAVLGDTVTVSGEVETQEAREKIILAVGNVEGVGVVNDEFTVAEVKEPAQFYTVVAGDTLSKIAKNTLGNANSYMVIFEANKPMLEHPDKIYPGQVLRIPTV
ncbi:MAG: peptidoglycan-binding protein LysM [Chitinophagales bacterium]|nr:peptidoglycan-binding protein LysM [Chitinophagales bacterium]